MDTRDLLRELEALEQVRSYRKVNNGVEFYTPNPVQEKAHKSKARRVLLCGANRIGKTTFGAVELAWHLTRKYPDWFPKERRFKRPIKAVVVCVENQFIEKVIEPKVRQYIPQDYIKTIKRVHGGYLNRIVCIDGSTVDFLSSEQNDMAFEGADFDFYWGDEPQQRRKYDAIQRGLVDRRGLTILTFTPLIEPWMKEDLVDKADGVNIDCITAVMRDNLYDIKGNTILSESVIQDFESSLSQDMKDTRIYGNFFHMRGVVYKEFSEVHTIEFDYQYPDPVISVLDPHDRKPHHLIWAIVDSTDDLLIHSEMSFHGTVQELAKAVRAHEKYNGYNMKRRLIDPNFGRKNLITTGRNLIQELRISGCPGWHESNDDKEEGHLKVKDYLHFNTSKPIDINNRPKIYFHKRNCPITIRSMRNYQYEDWVGKTKEERDPKEAPKQKDSDGADTVRYLCMSNPSYGQRFQEAIELEQSPY